MPLYRVPLTIMLTVNALDRQDALGLADNFGDDIAQILEDGQADRPASIDDAYVEDLGIEDVTHFNPDGN